MKVAVLGGFGLMAEAALHDLAAQPDVARIYAADIHLGRAQAVLSRIPNRKKIVPVEIDLTKTSEAAKKLKGAQAVLNASWYEFNLKAMELALALKAHYVDLGGLYHMTLKQLKLDADFKRKGLGAVLGCGSTPGITNMMVARMSERFEKIETVGIYDASHDPTLSDETFLPPFSIHTMLDEYLMPAPVLLKGRMTDVPAHSQPDTLDFAAPIGRVVAGTVIHSETATLPGYLKDKGVKNLFFKIVYPPLVKRQLAMLVGMGLHRHDPVKVNGSEGVSPRHFVAALARLGAAQGGPKPADYEVLRVRIDGSRGGRPLSLTWDCTMRPNAKLSAGAIGVGFAGSLASLLLLRRQTLRHGAAAPESLLEPDSFFKGLKERRQFTFSETVAQPLAM